MSETNNGVEVLAATGGGQAMMAPGGGLSGGKLALATAETGDVLAGKTYYAGDKELKTGTLALADATATESDVASGKTFFAGDNTIKTGTHKVTILTLATSSGNTTINVKDKCPNWANLTSSNFFISSNYSSLYHRFPGGSDPHADIRVYAPSVSYNASTGNVTVNRGYIWCEAATSGGSTTGTSNSSWTLRMAF